MRHTVRGLAVTKIDDGKEIGFWLLFASLLPHPAVSCFPLPSCATHAPLSLTLCPRWEHGAGPCWRWHINIHELLWDGTGLVNIWRWPSSNLSCWGSTPHPLTTVVARGRKAVRAGGRRRCRQERPLRRLERLLASECGVSSRSAGSVLEHMWGEEAAS